MDKYNIGDYVKIRVWERPDLWLVPVKDGDFFHPEKTTIYDVLIIGIDHRDGELQCLCNFDPHSYMSYTVEDWHTRVFNIDPNKWLGQKACPILPKFVYVPEAQVKIEQVHKPDPGGMNCKLCNKFVQYADVNRDDGTFACHSCVDTKSYLLKCNPL